MSDDETKNEETVIEGLAGEGLAGESGDPTQLETSDSGGPYLGTKSVLVELDKSGHIGSGVSLRRLDDESGTDAGDGPERYKVLETLGEGGMGKVHLVADRDLKRRVAMKVMRKGLDAHKARFLEEVQVHAQLDHPNIVPVHDLALSTDKRPYCTMRHVRGRTLEEVIGSLKKGDAELKREFSITRLMQIFQQITQAIGYAHDKGVIHRDLKPANVMLGEHGEVQVLDWGLAKVLDRADLERPTQANLTTAGRVMGTFAYMPPEQAMGKEVDERADIYSLGVMLYELLTLTRPFNAKDQMEMMGLLFTQPPEPPRARAAERNVPLELEAVCLKLLAKRPEERQQSCRELLKDVQEWLEASADKEKRHELAEAKAAEGRAKLDEYQRLKDEVVRLGADVEEVRGRFESWQPASEKADLFAAEDAATEARAKIVEVASLCVAQLEKALGFEDDNATAREALADYYWDRFLDAEERFDAPDVAFFGSRVSEYHDGKYAVELKGDGSLTLRSEPPGASTCLYELLEEGPVLVERNERELGTTPLAATPLAMGSYLVVLKKEGFRDTRYPVYISRNKGWIGEVKLGTDHEIGEGFVHVPAGPCVLGGDPDAPNVWPRSEAQIDDFFIAEQPVTMAEYLEFLNELAHREGLEAAKTRSPRRSAEDARTNYLLEDGQGGLLLPEIDAEGDRWYLRCPVLGVSWHDAMAYCEWRSQRDGVEYRLSSEEEWEKAARGVDGRWFPWGWRFDPSLGNMRESRKERPSPVVIDEFPTDLSVYGIRGLGGNMRDWTSTEYIEGTGDGRRVSRVSRGGCWSHAARRCRAASRDWNEPAVVDGHLGFRLSRSR